MSTGNLSGHGSRSLKSSSTSNSRSRRLDSSVRPTPPPPAYTPENGEVALEPCAATASFLLYAQRNRILVLHHDTLAIERRFDLHLEDVLWIAVDNVSERGSGRLAVSFDAGNTAIVWDILSGGEVTRFSAYEHMRVATFMRNGNIAFGNDQGNIILLEPATSEHISARTIFDPITAIAPAHDCRTFAIGYLNGSILIATLQPSFTILHTLNTNRSPSRITGLAWHGSSSKQKTDMLATQTQDGDLRVWSVPKASHSEPPTIIRVLQRSDVQQAGPCWFAWSKNGRLVQLVDGETRAWDVRTKKVTYDVIPTIEGVVGISNYGPTATLFTLGRNHTVQQYDISPNAVPLQVVNAQHAPANTPPTPPTTLEDRGKFTTGGGQTSLPVFVTDTESSADESAALSPLQKIAREMDSLDALESEIRDKVMPLSPSSHGGSVSSRSSGKGVRRQRKYLYDRPDSSRTSTSTGYEGTEFSFGAPSRGAHESMSTKSASSFASGPHRHRSSNLRKEMMRSPKEVQDTASMDLFPFTKARLKEVAFRTPHYGEVARTAELLQREMLSVVFGWNDDIRSLIREELSRQRVGSASGVLLSKWLGDVGADDMASMVGSESMTSSDWMLLALSSIGSSSQKKVGETFVQRLLEKGDVHPAVAILLGLGEVNDAIEIYVSRQYPMEAVLLTCLTCPSDWGRVSHLLRKWGEHAVMNGEAELAVRCFSCTSIETSAPWTSPRAQDAVFSAREQLMQPLSAGPVTSPTYSIPSIGSGRMTTKTASLKLITSFGDKGAPVKTTTGDPLTTVDPATVTAGVTPIINSALPMSPGSLDPWRHRSSRTTREPSSARTATPGGRRKRLPSRGEIERAKQEAAEIATTPLTAARDFATINAQRTASRTSNRTSNSKSNSRRTSSVNSLPEPTTALKPTTFDAAELLAPRAFGDDNDRLPSPAQGVFNRLREDSRNRNMSKDRNLDHLTVEVMQTKYADAPETGNSLSSPQAALKSGTLSPPLTGGSSKASPRGRPTDEYISSIEEARLAARQDRAESRRRGESRKRGESRARRAGSRVRDVSETRGRGNNVRYIKPAKRSPSSPVPMSPEEIAQATQTHKIEPATTDDESFYKVVQSPVESHRSGRSGRSEPLLSRRKASLTALPGSVRLSSESAHLRAEDASETIDDRGRSEKRLVGSAARSPSSPLPVLTDKRFSGGNEDTQSDGQRFRLRSKSANRRSGEDLQTRRQAHRTDRERSTSRRPMPRDDNSSTVTSDLASMSLSGKASDMSYVSGSSASLDGRRRGMSRKELAAKELEERRRSLARRPSAPQIPLPGELAAAAAGAMRPQIGGRSYTELGDSPTSYMPPMSRSHTVDPESMYRYNSQNRITGMSTPSAPIGLPATPRAMRHPHHMGSEPDERDRLPPVPDIPGKFSDYGSISGSSLSGMTSNMSDLSSSLLSSQQQKSSVMSSLPSRSMVSETDDSVGPLLPSTVFGQKGSFRSASAPPEPGIQVQQLYRPGAAQSSRRLSHVRKISPPEINTMPSEGGDSMTSIDAALHGSETQVLIIPEEPETAPAILPELQHLAMPPPPPPPPMFPPSSRHASGVINIAIDDKSPTSAIDTHAPQLPAPMERAATASPSAHRRNAPSGSGDSFGARIRGIGDRMRSSSKNRTKSPAQDYKPAPYESVQPPYHGHQRRESLPQRAQSPYEQAMAAQNQDPFRAGQAISPIDTKINETSIPPSSLPGPRSASAMGSGYRNPKEIRANMPPETLQQGVYPGNPGFL